MTKFLTSSLSLLQLAFVILFSSTSMAKPGTTEISVAVARSFADTGIFQLLARDFNQQHPGITINIEPVGSLQALQLVRQQSADLVITHYPLEEKRLVEEGFASRRTELFHSHFAVLGPYSDEYRLKQQDSISQVLEILAREEVTFITPSAKGGTYGKIEELWSLSGINPQWLGYEYAEISSLGAMQQAAQMNGYTIADLGTYLSNKARLPAQFVPLFVNDLALQNIYSVLLVNKPSNPASTFYQYLVSSHGQRQLKRLGEKIFHAAIIEPMAHQDPQLVAERKASEYQKHQRHFIVGIVLLMLLLIFAVLLLYKSKQVQHLSRREYQVEQRFRMLVESSPDWIWEVDENAVYTYASPRVEQLLGYKPEEIVGKTPFDLMPAEEAQRVARIFSDIAQHREAFEALENTNTHKNGHAVVLETSGVPLFSDKGEFTGYRGIDRDITQRKLDEEEHQRLQRELQQAHKMESLGQLTGGIAHDFNNLLGIILGYAELAATLNDEHEDDKLSRYLSQIEQAGNRAKNLVAQMLLYSRNDKVDAEPLELNKLINEDMEMLRAMLPTSINIKMEISDHLPAVMMNRTQMEQIIMNLCVNARDAMEGSGNLTINLGHQKNVDNECSVTHKAIEGDYVVLTVCDEGKGITEDVLKHIFDPFFTTKEKSKGTGMGLSVVYGIVSQYDGAIVVDSEPGKGTCFQLFFPVIQEPVALQQANQ